MDIGYKKPVSTQNIIFLFIFLLFIILSLPLDALAGFNDTSPKVIHNEVASLVNAVVNGSSPLGKMTWIFFWFFTFLLIVKNVYFYVMAPRGFSMEDLITNGVYFAFALVLMLAYNTITSALFQYSNGVAAGIQQIAFGNDDPYFLSKYIITLLSGMEVSGVNILTDGLRIVGTTLIYEIVSIALIVIAKVAAIWSTWGYSLAKIIGLIFIPFFLLEPTRFLYSGWLRFFLGFLLFNIMVRVSTIVVAFQIRADFIDLGGAVSGSTGSALAIAKKVVINKQLAYASLSDIIATGILSIIFVLMAAKASMALVGGGGSGPSDGGIIRRMVSAKFGKVT